MAGGRCSSGENPAMFLKEQSKAGKGGPWCAAWWPHVVGEALVRWQRAAGKKAFSVPQKKKRKKSSFSNCFPLSCHDMNVRPGTCVPGTVAVAARSSRILGTNCVLFPYFLLGWCPQPPRGGILWFRISK